MQFSGLISVPCRLARIKCAPAPLAVRRRYQHVLAYLGYSFIKCVKLAATSYVLARSRRRTLAERAPENSHDGWAHANAVCAGRPARIGTYPPLDLKKPRNNSSPLSAWFVSVP